MIRALLHPRVQDFLLSHEGSDLDKLLLKGESIEGIPPSVLVEQIQSRRKAKEKLPAWYHTTGILYPSVLSMEQASSEITAMFKQRLVQGHTLVDLTGGFGVDLSYLSRGFTKAHYVEQESGLCELARHNFSVLGIPHVETHHQSAESFLIGLTHPVDVLYLDPARRKESKKVVLLADCSPDLAQLLPILKQKARRILIKTSPLLDISAALHDLPGTTEVWVVAVNNEVKEVLYLVDTEKTGEPRLHAINLQGSHEAHFSFLRSDEEQAVAPLSLPMRFVYEPHAALMKAGAFKYLAVALGVSKLHPHSHLYTSDTWLPQFPGRGFVLRAEAQAAKKHLMALVPEGKANLTVRNFPMKTEELRKKLGIKEGGETYLLATTLLDGSKKILVCEKAPSAQETKS